jgi:hypothetical protein
MKSKRKSTRRPPSLRLRAVYIPYVCGDLIIAAGDIKHPNMIALRPTNLMSSAINSCVLRFMISPSKFVFSSYFQLNGLTETITINKKSKMKKIDTTMNLIHIPIDILHDMTSYPYNNMFELEVLLLNADRLVLPTDNTVDESKSSYVLGVGKINTAALYYQATRNAASAPMPDSDKSKPESDGDQPQVYGVSPWKVNEIDILDINTHKVVATALISCKFALQTDAVRSPVLELINKQILDEADNSESLARIELGLKQTFQFADADGSGNVSSEEVIISYRMNNPLRLI